MVQTYGVRGSRTLVLGPGLPVLEAPAIVREVLEGVQIGHGGRIIFECCAGVIVFVGVEGLGGTFSRLLFHGLARQRLARCNNFILFGPELGHIHWALPRRLLPLLRLPLLIVGALPALVHEEAIFFYWCRSLLLPIHLLR